MLALHADQIDRYGGSLGIRAAESLESALATPAMGGRYLHGSLHERAAAYLFHLVRNHPFLDGNKRAGLVAMLAFAGLNGFRIEADEDEMVDLVVGVAEGRTRKAEIAVFVKHHCRRLRRQRRRRTDHRGK